MYKLRPFINLKIMRNVYHALFYSHMVYGIEVWGSVGVGVTRAYPQIFSSTLISYANWSPEQCSKGILKNISFLAVSRPQNGRK